MSFCDKHCSLHFIFMLFFIIVTSVDSIEIRVENKGGYMARVLVRYHDSKGQEQLRNSGSFSAFRSAIITIENNIKSIEIEVQMYVFFNSLRTIFKTINPCPHTRCFVVWGTVFKADYGEICCQQ